MHDDQVDQLDPLRVSSLVPGGNVIASSIATKVI
jgi:hypothetical protein